MRSSRSSITSRFIAFILMFKALLSNSSWSTLGFTVYFPSLDRSGVSQMQSAIILLVHTQARGESARALRVPAQQTSARLLLQHDVCYMLFIIQYNNIYIYIYIYIYI
jgi:hypothetical protein